MQTDKVSLIKTVEQLAESYDLVLDSINHVNAKSLEVNFVTVGNVITINFPDTLHKMPRELKVDLIEYIFNVALSKTDALPPDSILKWVKKYPKQVIPYFTANNGIKVIPGIGRYSDIKGARDDDMNRIYDMIMTCLYPDDDYENMPEDIDVEDLDDGTTVIDEDSTLPTGEDLMNDFDGDVIVVDTDSVPDVDPLQDFTICIGENLVNDTLNLISFADDATIDLVRQTLIRAKIISE